MNIAILDGVVIAVVLISAILAMFRGFVREVLSIAAWVAAAVLAYFFYEEAMPYVQEYVDNPTIAMGISIGGIFLVSLIVVSLITMKISDFVMDSPVGALDRLLGFVFGAARGLLLVVVAVIFFNWLVAAPDRPAWVTTAATYPKLSELGEDLLRAIPDDPESTIRGVFENPEGGDAPAPAAPAAPAPAAPAPTNDTNAGGQSPTVAPQNQNNLDQLIEGTQGATGDTPAAPAAPAAPATPAPAAPADGTTGGGTN